MPWRPQPQKKGTVKKDEERTSHKEVRSPSEKKEIATLIEKIESKLVNNSTSAKKAALILSWWINGNKRK